MRYDKTFFANNRVVFLGQDAAFASQRVLVDDARSFGLSKSELKSFKSILRASEYQRAMAVPRRGIFSSFASLEIHEGLERQTFFASLFRRESSLLEKLLSDFAESCHVENRAGVHPHAVMTIAPRSTLRHGYDAQSDAKPEAHPVISSAPVTVTSWLKMYLSQEASNARELDMLIADYLHLPQDAVGGVTNCEFKVGHRMPFQRLTAARNGDELTEFMDRPKYELVSTTTPSLMVLFAGFEFSYSQWHNLGVMLDAYILKASQSSSPSMGDVMTPTLMSFVRQASLAGVDQYHCAAWMLAGVLMSLSLQEMRMAMSSDVDAVDVLKLYFGGVDFPEAVDFAAAGVPLDFASMSTSLGETFDMDWSRSSVIEFEHRSNY